MKKLEKGILIG